MRKYVTFALLLVALGLVACGGKDKTSNGGGGKSEPAAKQPAGGKAVSLKGLMFNPAALTVKVGDTVTWTNDEDVRHDVTKESGPGPDFSSGKGNMTKGDTYQQTFKQAGRVKYLCTIHPNMKGTITVQ